MGQLRQRPVARVDPCAGLGSAGHLGQKRIAQADAPPGRGGAEQPAELLLGAFERRIRHIVNEPDDQRFGGGARGAGAAVAGWRRFYLKRHAQGAAEAWKGEDTSLFRRRMAGITMIIVRSYHL